MSVYHPYRVEDPGGQGYECFLVRTLNIGRTPSLRQDVLNRTFQVYQMEGTNESYQVHRDFAYVDPSRGDYLYVLPKGERYDWKVASSRLKKSYEAIGDQLFGQKKVRLRVVFGMEELREKLVSDDLGLDDRVVELMKVQLLHEHPFLMQKPRLNLHLDRARKDTLTFVAYFDHNREAFEINLPRDTDNRKQLRQLKRWVKKNHQTSLFELEKRGDYWVSIWRWAPQTSALKELRDYADQIDAGKEIDLDDPRFLGMLDQLPHGNHLAGWAKKSLQVIYRYAKARHRPDLEDRLFEIRFDMELEDDWSMNNDPDDIDTLWNLLKDLPDSNVEGNSYIKELLIDEGTGGGWYWGVTHQIGIGENELASQEGFEDVVRHEVGHAVHEQNRVKVTRWLRRRFGWRTFKPTKAGINRWVNLMGGWGDLGPKRRRQVREVIGQVLGTEDWYPGDEPNLPAQHPWRGANFGPRMAFEGSTSGGHYWWHNYTQWYVSDELAFAYNFYYKTLMAVNVSALDLVAQMPDSYAAMSPDEFFAELYAVYYDVEDDYSFIPFGVTKWLNNHVGLPDVGGA